MQNSDLQRRQVPASIGLNSISIALRILRQILSLPLFDTSPLNEILLFVSFVEMMDIAVPADQSHIRGCQDVRITSDCDLDGNVSWLESGN